MTLFRLHNLPLSFNFVGLDSDDLSELTELVERYGGKVINDDGLPIKFTKPAQFVSEAFPKFKLYDVEFIRECVRQSAIVDPTIYRIGKPMLYDNCVMLHYLKGFHDCCKPKQKSKTDDTKFLNKSLEVVRRGPGRPRKTFSRHSTVETVCKDRLRTSSPENIIMLTPDSQQSDTSDDEMMMSVAKRRRSRGLAYSFDEEREMLNYIIHRKLVHKSADGPTLWCEMHADGFLQHRTGASLYSHYRTHLLPNIERHTLTAKQMAMFKELQKSTQSPIKNEKRNNSIH